MDLLGDARAIADELIEFRRDLHREPEVGLHLPRTQRKVRAALDGLPLKSIEGAELSSVTAVLEGGEPGPVVLLRAEMDALPLTERADVACRSRFDDAMHACGHDLHAAMLVGAARLLATRIEQLPGSVVLMFQPGEEGHDGARLMLDEGVLDVAGRGPLAAYAVHVSANHWPTGQFATRDGPLMAASDHLRVTVHGSGGHGSTPAHARNPIPAACAMVGELNNYLARTLAPTEQAVLSVGTLHAGTAANVIPDTATFEATVRTFDPEVSRRLASGLTRLCHDIATTHDVTAEADYTVEYPPTLAAPAESRLAADVVRDLFGDGRYTEMTAPLTASEDFARVLAEIPGTILQLGACPTDQDYRRAPANHSPDVVFDEAVIADGAALYAALALRRLASAAGSPLDGATEPATT